MSDGNLVVDHESRQDERDMKDIKVVNRNSIRSIHGCVIV